MKRIVALAIVGWLTAMTAAVSGCSTTASISAPWVGTYKEVLVHGPNETLVLRSNGTWQRQANSTTMVPTSQ